MPGGYESGLRIVEHYLGRGSATKQTEGQFIQMSAAPDLNVGRLIRNAANRMTGTAAQAQSTITSHGVRPTGTVNMDAKPAELIMPLMSLCNAYKYTVITAYAGPGPPYDETGTFLFALPDAKPDSTGAVVGTYNDAAADYNSLVAISDVYSFGIELLYGHGDLADTGSGLTIDNFVVNQMTLTTDRGPDNFVEVVFSGFGRDGDEAANLTEAGWGVGINGVLSTQPVLTPDKASFTLLELNDVDVSGTWSNWMDGITIEMGNGLGGHDSLGFDSFNVLETAGRPFCRGTVRMTHVDPGFLIALKNAQKFEFTALMDNGSNDDGKLQIKVSNARFTQGFAPDIPGPDGDITAEIPWEAVVDPTVALPPVEISLTTQFDVRTSSFFASTTLAGPGGGS